MAAALITGASRGLGRALAGGLGRAGWSLIIDGRDASALGRAETELRALLRPGASLLAVAGDVADPAHRDALAAAVGRLGSLDVLVNNASTLGASPLPPLTAYPVDELRRVLEVNTVAPLAVLQAVWPWLSRSPRPRLVNITSDAAVESYPGWGGYGLAKAALDHQSDVLAVEEGGLRVWAVDPGDLRTQMHQEAFPGEDISDRPEPQIVVPALVALLESDRPSGRIRLAADAVPTTGNVA
jgi:NAD(P)-dependent dehydrogenase (short-subunit alcohol dehydrogenase family)